MMESKTYMQGLGHFAAQNDIYSIGYLTIHMSTAAQRSQWSFDAYCNGMAAVLLCGAGSAPAAKAEAHQAFRDISHHTDTGEFSDDEQFLVDQYLSRLGESIDGLASKSQWQLTLRSLFFRTPYRLKSLLLLMAIFALAGILGLVLKK